MLYFFFFLLFDVRCSSREEKKKPRNVCISWPGYLLCVNCQLEKLWATEHGVSYVMKIYAFCCCIFEQFLYCRHFIGFLFFRAQIFFFLFVCLFFFFFCYFVLNHKIRHGMLLLLILCKRFHTYTTIKKYTHTPLPSSIWML